MSEDNGSQFIESCRQQYKQLQQELKEVDMMIQQTSSEVDRLVQRNAHAVATMRQVENQFETIPREDIQSAYNALVESQQRLFTMRGQLEKLQSDQKNKMRLAELYSDLLEHLGYERQVEADQIDGEGATSQKAMVVSIIEAQERERQRLSRQMHDGPAQSLTNLVLQAEICERFFQRDPEQARTELTELKDNVVGTFKKVKAFIFSLRPMMLDDLGLVPTLKRYVDGLKDSGFSGVTLNVTGKERRFASYKEVTIFRVIQELHHIASEYGDASNVKISLDAGDEDVRVIVEDDGKGFELGSTLNAPEAKRLGLPTLRERIQMLGGEISFDSAPGQGMRVTFSLSISENPDVEEES